MKRNNGFLIKINGFMILTYDIEENPKAKQKIQKGG